MTYLFVGGEDHDFTKIGNAVVDTATTAARRTANARCSLRVSNGSATVGDGWQCAMTSASSFWLTGRVYISAMASGTLPAHLIALLSGAVRRLTITTSTSGATGFWRLNKINSSGTVTTLVTTSVGFTAAAQVKVDVFVNYAVAGQVQVYLDNTKIIDYSGDVTTDGVTSLDGAVFGHPLASGNGTNYSYWSEIICTTDDTRAFNLVTLPLAGNGNAFAWTGSHTDLSEVTLNDATIATSAAAGDLAQATVSTAGITGNPAIRAVCISARTQKGGSGPQNLQLNVRTGGNDYFSATQALPAALNRVAAVFETNPATSGAFAYTDLTAAGFNIGVKSVA